MQKQEYSIEHMFEILNDKTGERIQVGSDRDGLNLVEIRRIDDHGKIMERISFDSDQAGLVAKAIIMLSLNQEMISELIKSAVERKDETE